MANFKFIDPKIGQDNVTATGTVKLWPLGMTAVAVDPQTNSTHSALGVGEFVYAAGGTNIAAGKLVMWMPTDFVSIAASASSASMGAMGLAAGAISNTNVYGWVQVRGMADNAFCQAAIAAGVGLKLAAAGSVSAMTGTADIHQVFGLANASSASAANIGTVRLLYPFYAGK
jgi:hypothetical protein